jgi:integrase
MHVPNMCQHGAGIIRINRDFFMSIPKVVLRKIIRKSDTTYILDYTLQSKRHRIAVGNDLDLAEEIRLDTQSKLMRGHFDLLPHEKRNTISLDQLIDEFLIFKKNSIRDTSSSRYKNYLEGYVVSYKKLFPDVVNDISLTKGNYIKRCMDYLIREGWSKKTINGMRELVSSMFKFAIEEGYIDKNPVRQTSNYYIPEKGKVIFFNDEQLEIIWNEIKPFWIDHIKFMLNTGLRKGEMINLKWENVTTLKTGMSITITSSYEWLTKTGKSRTIPLNKTATDIINKLKGRHDTYVFTNEKGLKIHPNQPYNALKNVLKLKNILGDVHALRHTFASNLVMKGVDLYSLSKLMGITPETAQIYAHLSPEYLRKTVEKLDTPK